MRSRRMSIQKEDNDFFTNLKMKSITHLSLQKK